VIMARTADSRRGRERSCVTGNRRPWGMGTSGLVLIALFFAPQGSHAQDVFFDWAVSLGGTGRDIGNDIEVDDLGNVYSTGGFEGTVDFDPGDGTFNFTSVGGSDIFVSKLDPGGNFVWAKAMGGRHRDGGISVTLDGSGNVYTTGIFRDTADFDPGAGTFTLTSEGDDDIFVSKLDASGTFVWAKRMGAASGDAGISIAVDGSDNVYTTGHFRDTVDFDPGPGTFELTSAGGMDIFVLKLDVNGTFVWAKSMGGATNDFAGGSSVAGSGNVHAVGSYTGSVDFDPGAETFNLTSAGGIDIFVSKLDVNGTFVWAKSMGGLSNNVGFSIAVDGSGNVYTTGHFGSTVDFDPGAGTFNLTSAGSDDIFVSKLDVSGVFVWTKGMGGAGDERGLSIAVDGSGNVYTTGRFKDTADFDPGAGTLSLTSTGSNDIFVSKLDVSGVFVWTKGMGGAGKDLGGSISVDGSGNVYAMGIFSETADFDPSAETFNLTSAGEFDIFVLKLAPDSTPPFVAGIAPSATGPTSATSISFSVTFSEDVQNFNDMSDIVVAHAGTANTGVTIVGGPQTYTVSVTGITGDGSFTVAVSTSSDVQDLAGNALLSSVTSAAVAIDNTPPEVSFIARATGDPTSADLVDFTVTFSEAVAGVDTSDFVVDQSGTKAVAGASVTGVIGSGDTYMVTVDSGTGNGGLSVDLSDDDSIVDLAGNPLGGVGVGNGDFTGGEAYTIDKTDTDGDGLPDLEEIALGTDPFDPDSDGDGLSDGEEENIYGTDPLNPDSDFDGTPDGAEVAAGTNPMTIPGAPLFPWLLFGVLVPLGVWVLRRELSRGK